MIEVEYVDDDEFRLLDNAVRSAEGRCAATQLALREMQLFSCTLAAHSAPPDQPPNPGNVPDLEDIGLCLDRSTMFRPRGLRVTDLADSEWCQQQVAFKLTCRMPLKAPKHVQTGSMLHAELEDEISTTVHVPVHTKEEAWGVQICNMIVKLHQLLTHGMTRELYLFGLCLDNRFTGIIDELWLDDAGEVRVVEYKTRYQPNLPHDSQQDGARLQVMMYITLYQYLRSCTTDNLASHFFSHLNLSPSALFNAELSQAFRGMIEPPSVARSQSSAPADSADDGVCLQLLLHRLHAVTQLLPPVSKSGIIRYLWQQDRSLELGCVEVPLDSEWLSSRVRQHAAFWNGQEPPTRVSAAQRWKCGTCNFAETCWRRPEN